MVILGIALAFAAAGHWKLQRELPVFNAPALLAWADANSNFGETSDAKVLENGVQWWSGLPEAAPLREALGRVRVRDGDDVNAFEEFRAAEMRPSSAGDTDGLPEGPTQLVAYARVRARVEEAALLLRHGHLDEAIETVGATLSLDSSFSMALRARALGILLSVVLRAGEGDGESGVDELFTNTAKAFKGAEPGTRAMLHMATAQLAEFRGLHSDAIAELRDALKILADLAVAARDLAQEDDAMVGATSEELLLGELHVRLAEAYHNRGSAGDAALAEAHGESALGMLWPAALCDKRGCPRGRQARPSGTSYVALRVGALDRRQELASRALRLLALIAAGDERWEAALQAAERALGLPAAAAAEGDGAAAAAWAGHARALGAEALRRLGRADEAYQRGWEVREASETLLWRGARSCAALWPQGPARVPAP